MKQTKIQDYFKPTIQNNAEELCRASAVMESMVDRLYDAENNLEINLKKVLEERDKVEEFENSSIQYFKDNGILPEWYIRYKLGKKLTVGYYLLNLVDGKYEEENNFSVGYRRGIYGKIDHWRLNFNVQDRDIEAEEYLKKTFNNYFFDKKVWIYSSKGGVSFKIIYEKAEEYLKEDPWADEGWDDDNGGLTTTEIVNRILSEVHKQVFIRVGYKKKKEKRQVGVFRNGNPKYKNFMVDDHTKPIYKFA
tara:strand:- start:2804 stop:3550 length:747 start_codon:yes stop_codon:yes gene_type:complete